MDLLDLARLAGADDIQLFQDIKRGIDIILNEENVALSLSEKERLAKDIRDELLGYGPLEPLLNDSTVSDILVNGYNSIYVERKGKLQRVPVRFKDNAHLLKIIEKIASGVGRRVDESCPMVDARLPDGSRVNAIISPLALDGPALSIRKFSKDPYKVHHLVEFGTITQEIAQVMEAMVKARLNILISGGTGSGKTTFLNVLSGFIPNDERIITIEDAAELQLQQDHVVRLETRPPNMEGMGEVTQTRSGPQCPAHASRKNYLGGGPSSRGPGHASGHEYRSRRLPGHYPCQYPPGRSGPPGNHGFHGRPQYSRQSPAPPGRLGHPRRPPGGPAQRWQPQDVVFK